ncbi:MAG TPA: HD domain-containing phosphohydrolase [Tepidisphaeraceae bacterium]|nr:HD domain-containing phosphohydrolase [Tepidisphaeraceae bacterium]
MLILSIDQAKAGMTLAAPVPHPDHPEQDLLKRGYALEEPVIKRLRDHGIDIIYVDYPGLEELDKYLIAQLSPARQAIYGLIKKGVKDSQSRARPAIPFDAYANASRDLIKLLLEQGPHGLYMEQVARMGEDAVGHATAVAHLALMMGLKLENYLIQQRKRLPPGHAKDVVNLGLAGMLHDTGKLELPENLRKYTEVNPPEDEKERREWETHCRLAYDMVHKSIEPSAACAILHHHQHYDGTGFPGYKHTDGTVTKFDAHRIHVFARILHVADLYDRLTAKPDKRRRTNLEIHFLMRSQHAAGLDPVVLQCLQQVCPPFPPGSAVGLSDGSEAIVVQVDQADPYRPIVRRKLPEEKMEETALVLRAEGAPGVVSVGGVQVEKLMPMAA